MDTPAPEPHRTTDPGLRARGGTTPHTHTYAHATTLTPSNAGTTQNTLYWEPHQERHCWIHAINVAKGKRWLTPTQVMSYSSHIHTMYRINTGRPLQGYYNTTTGARGNYAASSICT